MDEMIERKEVFRILRTSFTEKEKMEMASGIASSIRERNRLEDDLSSIKAQFASDIKKYDAEITSLVEKINTGWEMRRIECEEERNFKIGSCTIWRKDIGCTVEERPMSPEERQMGLFPPDKKEEVPTREGSSIELKSVLDETQEIINKTDLPEDNHPFYNQDPKKRGRPKKEMVLPE